MARKQRDYKAEYQRRIQRAKDKGYSRAIARGHAPRGQAGLRAANFLGVTPGSDLGLDIDRDKNRVFGRKIRRQKGDTPEIFQERLIEEQRKPEHALKWTSEEEFIASLVKLGLTEREAYTHWFS
jgi:hypothetical protein